MRGWRGTLLAATGVVLAAGCAPDEPAARAGGGDEAEEMRWLAGDHHVHSRFSVGWDREASPPTPIIGGDAIYPIPTNAQRARDHGLDWMVATDHGGPNHSKVNAEQGYPELLEAREAVPEVIQFYGMEFDTPGGDHSSLIIPHSHEERDQLETIESSYSRFERWPEDPSWNEESRMLEALVMMREMEREPVVIANHPSRSTTGLGEGYGMYEPAEFRAWNDTAPRIAVGMAGAPGHQAIALARDGSLDGGPRGGYGRHPTMGGFDQMTAQLGGFWDSMLGEGRRWWITANSDSHIHYTEGGIDFWPGEYSKTYVLATKSHDAILEGIRSGRVFVTTGDLISELWVEARVVGANGAGGSAGIGEALRLPAGADVEVTIRFLDPEGANHGGGTPSVRRVDLIMGEVHGPVDDPDTNVNPTTRVVARLGPDAWTREGAHQVLRWVLEDVAHDSYIRVRGTNGTEMEPEPDGRDENPWEDLWFYSNPIFLEMGPE